MNSIWLIAAVVSSLAVTACGGNLNPFDRRREDAKNTIEHRSTDQKKADACSADTVLHVSRPQNPDQSGGANFDYAYQYVAPAAGEPTVVYIPGGPGQTAIGEDSDWKKKLPDGFGFVLTDPRGVGCNAPGAGVEYDETFYKSRFVADDIMAAVKELALSNFLIYGISYGTEVATIAASKAEGRGMKPTALVLEGVLGRAMEGNEADATYSSLWDAKLAASSELAAAFRKAPLPLGYTANQWLTVIRSALMYGEMQTKNGPADILDMITTSAIATDATSQAWAKGVIDQMVNGDGPIKDTTASRTFYAYIACREVFSNLVEESLVNGHMISGTDNMCTQAGLAFTEEKYDAAKWPVTQPIYYFVGDNDPATPKNLGHYHFEHETAAKSRQLVLVGKGGHNPLELSLSGCMGEIWTAMGAAQALKTTISEKCVWPAGISLESAAAGAAVQTTTVVPAT